MIHSFPFKLTGCLRGTFVLFDAQFASELETERSDYINKQTAASAQTTEKLLKGYLAQDFLTQTKK